MNLYLQNRNNKTTIKIAQSFAITIAMILFWAFPGSTIHAAQPESQPRDALEYFFHQSFMNLEEEAEIAGEEGKTGLFIMFNDPDCPWCQKMKATVLNQVHIQDYYRKHFRNIHLDTTGDTTMVNFDGTELAEKDFAFKIHRVRATPVFMFFDLKGNKILRFTGATRNINEFLWLGEFIVNGEYKNKKFPRYKRERYAQLKNKNNLSIKQ